MDWVGVVVFIVKDIQYWSKQKGFLYEYTGNFGIYEYMAKMFGYFFGVDPKNRTRRSNIIEKLFSIWDWWNKYSQWLCTPFYMFPQIINFFQNVLK